ncbi:MAG TPA: VWA domain-containing protein [Candidatus Levybacteria bacterium]|nr:VWA domain-containing protein [Candidatus Levybacteria bacterium]
MKILNFFSNSHGSITFKVLMAVVILGSISLVSGVFPKNQITPQDPNAPRYKPIDEDTVTKKSLQLKTIKFQQCSSISAIDLLVDYSGSMGLAFSPTKLPAMQEALKIFGQKLTDNSLIALHTFNNTNREIIPFSLYKDVKANYDSNIDRLNNPQDATHTRSALTYIKPKIEQAQAKWPGYQFSVILLSDGIPERANTPIKKTCPVTNPKPGMPSTRNFSITEDPTQPPNVADDIKNLGVRVFSIAILDQTDQCFSSALKELMQNVASPDSYYETYNPDDLKTIYNNIVFEVCNQAG